MIKRIFFVITALILGGCSASQNAVQVPQNIVDRGNAYLMSRLSIKFFRQYITLDDKKSAVDSPYYHLVYRFSDPGRLYINETIMLTADMDGTIDESFPPSGIPLCWKDTTLCTFNIDELLAVQIAKDNNLPKGIKDWKADFTWEGKFNRYIWKITSYKSESQGSNGYRGSGEVMMIDPAFGKVLDRSEWFVR